MAPTAEFQLILADIAVAAAVKSCGAPAISVENYQPGVIRQRWLDSATDADLKRRVNALASAGAAALRAQPASALLAAARSYGVPLDQERADQIARHFAARRDALMTYDR